MKHIAKDKKKRFCIFSAQRPSFPLRKKGHLQFLVRQNEYIIVLCLDIVVRIKFGFSLERNIRKDIYTCMHKCQYLRTYFRLLIYIYIYQFLPWLVCPIFFPSHDTSKLERDFLLVLNNCKHCALCISCYTYIFESLLFESKSIDMHFER